MDTAVVQQFLNFFQEYLDLCMLENWPDNNTSPLEVRFAFQLSQRVETCLDKLQTKGIVHEFLLALNSQWDTSNDAVKSFLKDPPKYILRKVMNSNINVNQLDVCLKIYLELFSAERLEACLTAIMGEAASKESLLSNLNNELDRDIILIFKSTVILSELKTCYLNIFDIVSSLNENTVEILVFCLLNSDVKYSQAVKLIKEAFLNIIRSRDCVYRNFWRLLFKVNDKYLLEMCIKNFDFYKLTVEALLDYGKLLRKGLSTELFYIELSQSELQSIVKRICSNDSLKLQFFEIVNTCDNDVEFWTNML